VSRTFKGSLDVVRCEVLVTVIMEDTVSWDVIPFSLVKVYKYFGETYCLDLQAQGVNQARGVSPVWEISIVDVCML
jgi:hypothetical protein